MIDVIDKLMKTLYTRIPNEILELGFREKGRSLDSVVREKVIVDVVLLNANLYSGQPKRINLKESWLKQMDDDPFLVTGDYCIYQVPAEYREHKEIVSVIDLSFPTIMSFSTPYPMQQLDGRSVAGAADEALGSMTRMPGVHTPQVKCSNNGIIELVPPMATHIDWSMLCWLSLDTEFSGISPNMIRPLSDMVVEGCKMVLWNKLAVKLNQGQLVGGQTLEAVKRIIDTYEDAEEKFNEALQRLRGASVLQANQLPHLLAQIL